MSKHAVMPLTDYVGVCDVIREKTSTNEPITSGELPEKINDVYYKGMSDGYSDGLSVGVIQGFEDGKTAEWNEQWDGLQSMGNRDNYNNFCAHTQFIVDRDTTPRWVFKPKYDIKPKNASFMFQSMCNSTSGGIGYPNINIDLTQWLENLDVTLDMSNCTNAANMFYNCQGLFRVPFLDLSNCTNLANFMAYSDGSRLNIIDGIKSSENTAWVNTTFGSGSPLKHCIFSGVIAKSLHLSNTQLDYESLMSVLNTLKDLSGTGATLTLTLGSKLQAKLTDTEKAIATQKGWTLA